MGVLNTAPAVWAETFSIEVDRTSASVEPTWNNYSITGTVDLGTVVVDVNLINAGADYFENAQKLTNVLTTTEDLSGNLDPSSCTDSTGRFHVKCIQNAKSIDVWVAEKTPLWGIDSGYWGCTDYAGGMGSADGSGLACTTGGHAMVPDENSGIFSTANGVDIVAYVRGSQRNGNGVHEFVMTKNAMFTPEGAADADLASTNMANEGTALKLVFHKPADAPIYWIASTSPDTTVTDISSTVFTVITKVKTMAASNSSAGGMPMLGILVGTNTLAAAQKMIYDGALNQQPTILTADVCPGDIALADNTFLGHIQGAAVKINGADTSSGGTKPTIVAGIPNSYTSHLTNAPVNPYDISCAYGAASAIPTGMTCTVDKIQRKMASGASDYYYVYTAANIADMSSHGDVEFVSTPAPAEGTIHSTITAPLTGNLHPLDSVHTYGSTLNGGQGGVLHLTGDGLTHTAQIVVGANSAISFDASQTYASAISGEGSLTVAGNRNVVLTGGSTGTGALTVQASSSVGLQGTQSYSNPFIGEGTVKIGDGSSEQTVTLAGPGEALTGTIEIENQAALKFTNGAYSGATVQAGIDATPTIECGFNAAGVAQTCAFKMTVN